MEGAAGQIMENHTISIVITSYNQKAFLAETLHSALDQTLTPYEIIIADDCSTDGSVKMIAGFQDRYPDLIKPLYQKRNLGVSANRSCGFRQAGGNLVTWANGDDRLLPRKLELELETYLRHPNARWVYSQVRYIDIDGNPTGALRYNGKYRKAAQSFIDIVTSGGREPAYQLINRSVLDTVGLFDTGLEIYEDWDFALRLSKRFAGAFCPVPLHEYRQYKGGLSSASPAVHIASLEKIRRKIEPMLADLPVPDAARAKRRLDAQIEGMKAAESLASGGNVSTLRFALKALSLNPADAFSYEIITMALFPKRLTDALRKLKRRRFPNMS